MSVGDLKGYAPTSAADLLSNLEKGDFTLENDNLMGSDLLDSFGSDFYEGFTDLSEYLLKESSAEFEMMDVGTIDGLNTDAIKGMKRGASEAFSAEIKPTPNPDHSDYISKKRRVSSTSSVDSLASETSLVSETTATPTKTKTQKYFERRRKNNIASKRSRETRKHKYTDMEQKAIDLEQHNIQLRQKVAELETMTKRMREVLIEKMTKK